MEDFHPFLPPIYFEMIDTNHIIIIGGMRTFNRRIEVGFMKKSTKLTNIGGVMNNNILTKMVIACLWCFCTLLVAENPYDQKPIENDENQAKARKEAAYEIQKEFLEEKPRIPHHIDPPHQLIEPGISLHHSG